MTFEDLRRQFETMKDLVREAARRLKEEERIADLRTLEKQGVVLCDKALKAEAQTARALQPFMAELIAELDSYAEQLADFQETNPPKK
ncbi:MAG: hypothetical protein IT559_06130 [Alphaproteobacteria bacterium]|nr:hypothetical protein [Alphaproteobacteria bacterium]